jgi:hypothetical protein
VETGNPGDSEMSERVARARAQSMDIAELIGLCKGVLADGTINQAEAECIQTWLHLRPNILHLWPADELHLLLGKVLADGILSVDEEAEMIALLEEMTGETELMLLL